MATRVNVKFLVILSGVLALVFAAVAGGFLYILVNKAPRLHREGQEALAAGDLEKAQEKFWASFHSDRSNLEPLRDYLGVLDQWVPDTQPEYIEAYRKRVGSLDHIAIKVRTDVEAHRRLLEEFYGPAQANGNRQGYETVITQASKSLAYFPEDGADEEIGVLRRYRGLAIVGLADIGIELSREQAGRDGEPGLAEQDLRAALAADPDDSESAAALSRLYRHLAAQLGGGRREADRKAALLRLARQTIDQYLESHPGDPFASTWEVQLSINEARGELDPTAPISQRIAKIHAVGKAQAPKLRAVADEIISRKTYDYDVITALFQAEVAAMRSVDITAEVLDHAVEARPGAGDLLFVRARAAATQGRQEKAIELYSSVISTPLPPVSLDGMLLIGLRDAARVGRIDAALALWEAAEPEAEAEALARVQAFRAEMGDAVREADPRITLIDGKIALARRRWTEAQEHLSRYNEVTQNTDGQALSLLAQVYLQKTPPEFGQARDLLRSAMAAGPTIATYTNLANVLLRLNQTEEALTTVDTALQYEPENAELLQLRRTIVALGTDPSEIESSNPVLAARIRADRLALPPDGGVSDVPGALAEVNRAIAEIDPSEPEYESLFDMKARYLLALARREEAVRTLEQATADFPESEPIRALLRAIERPDTLEGDFQIIEEQNAEPALAYVMKHARALARGEEAIAAEMLASAVDADRKHPQVIEAAFSDALRRGDDDGASTFAALAAEVNLDQIKGVSYRARIQAARGDYAGAITTLENAAKSRTSPAAVHRLMGMYQIEAGRRQEGLASLELALRRAPTDARSAIALITAHRALNQPQRALSVARDSESFCRADPQFQELLLELEASHGDKEAALTRRLAAWNANPNDLDNAVQLCSLQLTLNRFDEAKNLIDTLLTRERSARTVMLEAQWHARQGDLPSGERIFERFIESKADDIQMADYGAYASFLLQHNMIEEAIAVFERARAIQDSETRRADAAMAELLYQLRRYEEAVEPLEAILPITGDQDPTVRARLADCYAAMERFDDARRVIEGFGQGWRSRMPLALSRAATEAAAGDRAEALRILDQTIQAFPNEPEPYVRRAVVLRLDERRRQDALQDIDTALRRSPGNWQALMWRATIYNDLGQRENALAALREAVRANPSLDTERRVLLGNLLQSGRRRDAEAIAMEAVQSRPNDFGLLVSLGDIFANWSLWDSANAFFARAWQASPNPASAYRYANSLLRKENPDYPGVATILRSDAVDLEGSSDFLLLLAELRMKRDQELDARRAAIDALGVAISNGPAETGRILDSLKRVFGDQAKAAEFIVTQRSALAALPDRWGEFLTATAMITVAERRSQAQEMLRGIIAAGGEGDVTINARRVLAQDLMSGTKADLEEAIRLMLEGLDQTPDYWPYANNIAVIYAKEMDRAEEALTYAEMARDLAPDNAYVLDTLGYVYRQLERYDDSARAFARAIETSRDIEMRLLALLHIGQMYHEKGDKNSAQAAIERIDALRSEMLSGAPADTDLEELREQVRSME